METVTVSQKYQVVLPRRIRSELEIKPGRKIVVVEKGGVIEMISVGKIRDAKGFAKGVSARGIRDESEHFG